MSIKIGMEYVFCCGDPVYEIFYISEEVVTNEIKTILIELTNNSDSNYDALSILWQNIIESETVDRNTYYECIYRLISIECE